jgi:hypothetical protein
MNERLHDLYKQAFGYFPSPIGEPELEKFAELIIGECVDAAFANGDDIAYIKKHFGVKE